MGKTSNFFMKVRDIKGTFHAKMRSIKDRNCMDLTEAEDIKKRWMQHVGSSSPTRDQTPGPRIGSVEP